MSTTMVGPDLLEQLGLQDDITCDWACGDEEHCCEVHATWWLICRSCNHHTALCAAHRAALEEVRTIRIERVSWRRREVHVQMVECEHCREQTPAGAWRVLYFLIPIVGA